MFTKLSALALCLSFVSAFHLVVEGTVHADSTIPVNATFGEGDPSYIDLLLVAHGFNTTLGYNVTLAPTMYVDIPGVHKGQYTIEATEVDDEAVIYATSNEFEIKD